jgi:hypothetical protein
LTAFFDGVAEAVVAGMANASTGAAANDVATTTDTAIDRAVRTAAPWITFNDENISVFISVLFWTGGRVTPV